MPAFLLNANVVLTNPPVHFVVANTCLDDLTAIHHFKKFSRMLPIGLNLEPLSVKSSLFPPHRNLFTSLENYWQK